VSGSSRPFVHLNFAVDGEGRMSASDGSSLPISTPADWSRVHGLRERYQAVAVGGRTWIRDAPRLDVRRSRLGRQPRRQPDRVVFGGGQPCTFRPAERRTYVVGSRAPADEGVVFTYCPDRGLARPLATLYRHGVGSLLVEGGPTLLRSFLVQGCFDRITAFTAVADPAASRRAVRAALPEIPDLEPADGASGALLRWPGGRRRPHAAGPLSPFEDGDGAPARPRARLPTSFGHFTAWAYEDPTDGVEHLALVLGDLGTAPPPLIRIHSECLTGDALGSLRCDCGPQLRLALSHIAEEGRGALLYLRQEGRGIGLLNKIRAYALQERGLDTVEANEHLGFAADLRDYSVAALMLADLGAREVRLVTNNPFKIEALEGLGIRVVERVGLAVPPSAENASYLRTKRDKLRHLLH